jgi:hypothetical protein
MREGILPPINVCRQIASTGNRKGNYKVPRLERFFTVEDIHRRPVQGPNPKVEWIDMWGDYVPSFFVPQNFSDKRVIESIMNASNRLCDEQMEKAESRQSTVHDIGPPISASFTFFQGDGAPIDMIGCLKSADNSVGQYILSRMISRTRINYHNYRSEKSIFISDTMTKRQQTDTMTIQ